MNTNQAVCFIGGVGHSGSTLLGMLLGSHSQVCYAGEAAKSRYLGDQSKPLRKRACKICGDHCPTWSNEQVRAGARSRDPAALYEALSSLTRRPLVVDSSKSLSWITERVGGLSAAGIKTYLLFLRRDGRAVINSRLRKYPHTPLSKIVEQWKTQVQETMLFFEGFAAAQRLVVQYEQLALQPRGVLESVCRLLGLDYEEHMERFWEQDQHPLGGNNGTQSLVARRQKPEAALAVSPRHGGYYAEHAPEIRLDLRWQNELPRDALEYFEREAGELNAAFAWEH